MVFLEDSSKYIEMINKTLITPVIMPGLSQKYFDERILIHNLRTPDDIMPFGDLVDPLTVSLKSPEWIYFIREQNYDMLITEFFPD
jgi:hypothetical protein